MSRNFTCPESEQPCDRSDCKVGHCVERIANDSRQARAQAAAREDREQFLRKHPEHLNLDDFV
jgi:hypothetical protein